MACGGRVGESSGFIHHTRPTACLVREAVGSSSPGSREHGSPQSGASWLPSSKLWLKNHWFGSDGARQWFSCPPTVIGATLGGHQELKARVFPCTQRTSGRDQEAAQLLFAQPLTPLHSSCMASRLHRAPRWRRGPGVQGLIAVLQQRRSPEQARLNTGARKRRD